ncbi:MAG: hypothetical protein EA397_06595 [Deltaproteobacteria bacterium]|nr:MAG: hypothetical protein EA397_06595 [Deltaproteobacteria bacterium]
MAGKKTRRAVAEGGLTITSLMDAMTIILCFLLKSYEASDVTVTPSDDLKIPSSSALAPIKSTVQLIVSQSRILVDGEHVVNLQEYVDDEGRTTFEVPEDEKKGQLISELFNNLDRKAQDLKQIHDSTGLTEAEFKGQILLQCDRNLPFSLIREVMYTAGQAQFGEFKFVVVSTSGG